MINVFEERFFGCPYCGESNALTLDYTAGLTQELVVDCTVCCRPIELTVELSLEGVVRFSAQRESLD